MIYFSSNDEFILKSIINLITQINPQLVALKDDYSFVNIEIQNRNYLLHFSYGQKKIIIKAPVKINDIFDSIIQLIFEKSVLINNFQFYPFKQTISYNNTEVKLNFISNKILRNLYLHKENGIDKHILYSFIWPKDKEILINKLDTHLTNTKNFIQDNFKIELNYASKKGIVKLLD